MIFEGSAPLRAALSRVWDFLLDMQQVSACVPGIQDVVQIDAETFDGTILAQVGPISGRFSFRAQIIERRPPSELTATISGTDSVTKSAVSGEVTVRLAAAGDEHTLLFYRSTVNVKGRLAILGEILLRATGNLMLQETIERMRKRLEERPAA